MDPNETLARIRTIVARVQTGAELDADATADALDDLADRVAALDEWITRGGFLPTRWTGVK